MISPIDHAWQHFSNYFWRDCEQSVAFIYDHEWQKHEHDLEQRCEKSLRRNVKFVLPTQDEAQEHLLPADMEDYTRNDFG